VPDVDEAKALAGLLPQFGLPAWLSYTIDGTCTRAGQPLADAFAVVADVPEIIAVGVNCCAPADVLTAITIARDVTDKPVVVYPNSGEVWDGARRNWIGTTAWSPDLVSQWVTAGATIVGGCCRCGPTTSGASPMP
jgi:homocysteine S-methyltransferase